jgi:hypothetical protein
MLRLLVVSVSQCREQTFVVLVLQSDIDLWNGVKSGGGEGGGFSALFYKPKPLSEKARPQIKTN